MTNDELSCRRCRASAEQGGPKVRDRNESRLDFIQSLNTCVFLTPKLYWSLVLVVPAKPRSLLYWRTPISTRQCRVTPQRSGYRRAHQSGSQRTLLARKGSKFSGCVLL